MKKSFLKLILGLAVISAVSASTWVIAVQAQHAQKRSLVASKDNVSSTGLTEAAASVSDCPLELTRSAIPSWMPVSLDGYTVSIPYSDDWQVGPGNCGYNAYEHGAFLFKMGVNEYTEPKQHTLFFGRPAFETGKIIPEYQIYRTPFVPETMDILLTERLDPTPNGCGIFEKMPLETRVGGKKGYKYFTGSAAWCALVFQFNQGKHVYTVQRDLEPSYFSTLEQEDVTEFRKAVNQAGPPDIDPEMEKIIVSFKES